MSEAIPVALSMLRQPGGRNTAITEFSIMTNAKTVSADQPWPPRVKSS